MATNLERYEVLKRHLPEEAAKVIAESFPLAEQAVTRDYLDARIAELRGEFYRGLNGLRDEVRAEMQSLHRWMLTFMLSVWLGMAGMIVAILIKG